MTKLRVYEYAKQMNMSSKEVVTILNRLDVPVANHMSVMDGDMVKKVEKFFSDVKQRAAERRHGEQQRAPRHHQESASVTNGDGETLKSDNGSGASGGTRLNEVASNKPSNGEQITNSETGQQEERNRVASEQTARNEDERPRDNRTGGHQGGGNRDGNRTGGYQGGGNRDGNRTGGYQGGGNRDGNRTGGYQGGGNRDGNRTGGYQGGGSQGGGNRTGGYQGGGSQGGGNRTGGYQGGGNRDGNRSGGYQGGGNRDGNRSGGYQGGGSQGGGNRTGGYQGGGNRSGGRPGGTGGAGGGLGGRRGPNAPAMQVQQKPTAPGALRKDKDREREKGRNEFSRKESFNEEKLQRGGRKSSQKGARKELPTEVTVTGPMTVADFAKLIQREASEIIKKLLFLGIMATINQEIETDAMELIAGEYNITMKIEEPVDEEALDMLIEEENPENQVGRPPVVTIMGHVDHGKTTLLDAIRESKVTASESGGITQHIGAYQVEVNERTITFLDTPGHEAFTTMRARGAQITDITILVVAADDGVMPQTVEALNHAKAAKVPIIVAVNKMDKPDANPDRVKQELMKYELVPEEWGGDTVFVNISALARQGLDDLLEMILLVADMGDLKANPNGRPRGTVIEAKLDKGRGTVATVLVQNGTLRVGDIMVAGTTYGRVRAMVDDTGRRIKEAGPSHPVEIQGFNEVPSAGDLFVKYDDERSARYLVDKRTSREKVEQQQLTSRVTLDDLYRQIKEGNMKDLNVIVKGDMQGSVEALVQSIEKIDVEGVRVKVIHRAAGAINESDVALASASNAIIIGFHVRPDVNAKRAAEQEKVDIRLYRVIYSVIEELEQAMKGLLDPEYKEVVLGHAEVRQVFTISRVGTVAGCYVIDGKMVRDGEVRLVRDGVVVFEGSLDTLKRFKDDVREVQTGYECGITLENYNDLKLGDVIEVFKMEALKVQ